MEVDSNGVSYQAGYHVGREHVLRQLIEYLQIGGIKVVPTDKRPHIIVRGEERRLGPKLPISIPSFREILQSCQGKQSDEMESNEYYWLLGALQKCVLHYENELAEFAHDSMDYSISVYRALEEIRRANNAIKSLKSVYLVEKDKSLYKEIIADFPDLRLELIEEKIQTTAKKEILDIISKHEISPYDNSDDYREKVEEIINF